MKLRMSETSINKIKGGTGTRTIFSDTAPGRIGGFQMIMGASGSKVFYVRHRVNGKLAQERIGEHGCYGLTLAEARFRATEIIRTAKGHGQPMSMQPFSTAPAPKPAGPTVNEVYSLYVEYSEASKRASTVKSSRRAIEHHLIPAIGTMPMRSVQKKDIRNVINGLTRDGKGGVASTTLKHVKAFFAWAVSEGHADQNICDGLRKPVQDVALDRVLTDEEIRDVFNAAGQVPQGEGVQISLLQGMRQQEVYAGRWDEISFTDKTWTIDGQRTKTSTKYVIPLSDASIAILQTIKSEQTAPTPWIFPHHTDAARSFKSVFARVRRISEISGTSNWSIRDCRRTFATRLQGLGYSRDVVDAALNHAATGLARNYLHHSYADEVRTAVEDWSRRVARLVSGLTAVNAR